MSEQDDFPGRVDVLYRRREMINDNQLGISSYCSHRASTWGMAFYSSSISQLTFVDLTSMVPVHQHTRWLDWMGQGCVSSRPNHASDPIL